MSKRWFGGTPFSGSSCDRCWIRTKGNLKAGVGIWQSGSDQRSRPDPATPTASSSSWQSERTSKNSRCGDCSCLQCSPSRYSPISASESAPKAPSSVRQPANPFCKRPSDRGRPKAGEVSRTAAKDARGRRRSFFCAYPKLACANAPSNPGPGFKCQISPNSQRQDLVTLANNKLTLWSASLGNSSKKSDLSIDRLACSGLRSNRYFTTSKARAKKLTLCNSVAGTANSFSGTAGSTSQPRMRLLTLRPWITCTHAGRLSTCMSSA